MASLTEAMGAAIAAHQANQFDRAEQIYRAVLQAYPDHAGAQSLLGAVLCQQGRPEEALPWSENATRLFPNGASNWSNLGMVLAALGRRAEAAAAFERAVSLDPTLVGPRVNWGIALAELGRFDQAVQVLQQAIAMQPSLVAAYQQLGSVFERQLRWEDAVHCYRHSLTREPTNVDTLCNLSSTLLSLGRLDEAEQALQQANALAPDRGELVARLALLQQAEGRIDEALASHRQAVALEPATPWIHSGYLMCLQYRPGITPGELAAEHAAWDRRHAAPLRSQWRAPAVDCDPERPLRLGFVSLDFGFHTVGVLMIRALEGLRGQPCEIVCYSDKAAPDPFTPRFVEAAHTWRQVEGLSDEALAEQIRADRIDVLFDLVGHTPRNRLLTFARKPAPIQITWLGYVGTTGLEAIDALVADPRQIPAGDERFYRERVLRLPDDYATFEPFPNAPPVGPLPAEGTGRVTFGSLNNPAKLNPEVIALWAQVLRRVPDSRLLLRYRGLEGRVRDRLAERFAAHGIEPERLELRGGGANLEFYTQYNEIDVALDPFPYSGGLTTIEALWMGVPVITMPGATFASRHALSHLTAVGLVETIAGDRQTYVDLAAAWASDLPRLAALRRGLRERVSRSALCDGPRFAANLMAAVRDMWRRWCEQHPSPAFPK
jgi:predicted O-linked N-acetylglucosamine transferase (SPINDLY family)